MPTFDFQCKKCSAVFEFSRPFGIETRPSCPHCKSVRTEKLLSPPAIQFKGNGFYKTDSVKKPAAKTEQKTEATVKESTVKPETKTEPKPAENGK
ncbi:MAG: zinc ribbon domain-containing protein [Candidatus Peribacteraceae bacterium]|nr:zinc ribbon domain-containing protein [Candidatus Peribacteraceae bacterium]